MTRIIVFLIASLGAQTTPPGSTVLPTLEIEKTHFAAGEHVFFWVGVQPLGPDPIPRSVWDTGRVVITRPDGTTRVDRIGWPIDGMGVHAPGDRGWRGGHRITESPLQVGAWRVVVEFGGERSKLGSFTVERLPILQDIDTAFVFTSPLILDAPDAAAILTVRNRSAEIVRFMERGQHDAHVSVHLARTRGPAWSSSFFVPPAVLAGRPDFKAVPMILLGRFGWDQTDQFPTVSVAPGGRYELRLPLPAALDGHGARGGLARIPAGTYDVTFSTELDLLLGGRDGPWKDFAPVRLLVTATATAERR